MASKTAILSNSRAQPTQAIVVGRSVGIPLSHPGPTPHPTGPTPIQPLNSYRRLLGRPFGPPMPQSTGDGEGRLCFHDLPLRTDMEDLVPESLLGIHPSRPEGRRERNMCGGLKRAVVEPPGPCDHGGDVIKVDERDR